MRWTLLVTLMTVILTLTGNTGDRPRAKLEVKNTHAKAGGDLVSAAVDKDTATVRVDRKFGIGKADVTLTEGKWPTKTRLVFQDFKNLEQVQVENGKVRLTTSLGYAPEVTVEIQQADGRYLPAGKEIRYTMPITSKDGRIVVEVPNLFQGEGKVLKIAWVDAFRR